MVEAPGSVVTADASSFMDLMAGFPTGVTIVSTFGKGSAPIGMTCTSMCSVSVRPPTLLVCLRRGSPTLAAIQERGSFTVSLLNAKAQAIAELFASGAPDRFDRVSWGVADGFSAPHLVDDAAGIAECRVRDVVDIADHAMVVGSVVNVAQAQGRPLLRGLRRYTEWPEM